MYRKNLIKSMAVGMACMLAVTTVGCKNTSSASASNSAASGIETSQDAAADSTGSKLESAMNSSAFAQKSEDKGKEETVYVISDASGKNSNVIVSDWLKNPDGSTTIPDESSLSEITNVKGNETFTKNSDGTITWNADGSDIYYQGTTTKQLPVNVNISFKLDGKDISAQELAGKSGRVTIHFDYVNNSKQTVNIDGSDAEIYTPFAMVSGIVLPTDKFSNIKVSNGKVISDANDYILMGVGLPKLKESLDLDEKKLSEINLEDDSTKIPDYWEITADTNDFQLGMTMTMATSDALSSLGFDELSNSDKIGDVENKVNELEDGVGQLRDGSGELASGTDALSEGTASLKKGTGSLSEGTNTLKDGSGKLATGAGKLKDGTTDLAGGVSELGTGVTTLKNGTSQLASGADTLKNGISSYTDGAATAASGAKDLDDGIGTLQTSVNGTLSSGVGELAKGASTAKSGSAQLKGGLETINSKFVNGNAKYAYPLAAEILTAMQPSVTRGVMSMRMSARAVEDVHSLTLDGNGGSSVSVTLYTEADEDGNITYYAKEPETPEREGHTFTGWYYGVDDDGKVTGEAIGSDEWPLEVDGSITLYAGWSGSEKDASTSASTTGSSEKDAASKASSDSSETSDSGKTSDSGAAADTSDKKENENNAGSGAENSANSSSDEKKEESTASSTEVSPESDTSDSVVTGGITLYEGETNPYASLEQAVKGIQAYRNAGMTYDAALNAVAQNNETKKAAITGGMSQLLSGTTGVDYDSWLALANDQTNRSDFIATETILNNQADLVNGVASLTAGAGSLDAGVGKIQTGINQLAGGSSELAGGVAKLKSGSASLASGMNTLVSNNQTLKDGASSLSSGALSLDVGAGTLLDGTVTLANGVDSLGKGATDLANGASSLDDGVTKLANGAASLDDGAGTLNSGAVKLADGAAELSKGIIKLDDEGISKISEAFNGDIGTFADRLDAVNKAGSDYVTFGGATDTENSSVKFIIKTDAIETDDN